jgi:hypothetical protein
MKLKKGTGAVITGKDLGKQGEVTRASRGDKVSSTA